MNRTHNNGELRLENVDISEDIILEFEPVI